jgi:predicted acetyltransferase
MSDLSGESDGLEYRFVSDADINEFHRLLSYAFRPTEAFEPIESINEIPDPSTVADNRGLYAGDELVSTIAHHWFTLRLRGEWHAVSGVAAVSTPPKHRRKGFIQRLLSASLHEYRERGDDFAALWPFEYSFYRKFGWGTCSDSAVSTCEPDALGFVDSVEPPSDGEFVDLSPDQWEELARVYDACNDHALAMQRTEEWWRKRVFQGRNNPYITGWERDGELRGYLVYAIEEGDDGREMTVSELVFFDHEAYLELVRFCRYHDSQVSEVAIHGPVDTTLHDIATDPRGINIEIRPGGMIRVVDVESALSALSYPTDESLSVVLDVDDDLAEWNDGRFRLTVEYGDSTCEPTTDDPDMTVGIATLSQIVVGYLPVERAILVGDLDVVSERGGETLSALFPEDDTYLRERF